MSNAVGSDNGFEEWQEARSVLSRFDDNLHDLRKYGFSFITGLLTADTLLGQAAASAGVVIPGYVKLAVFVVTLGLICTLRLLDMHYRRFQWAASLRAKLLEKRLNLDLTGTIAFFYDLGSWWEFVQYVYVMFIGLTALLGLAVLWPNTWEIIGLAVAVGAASLTVVKIHGWKGTVRVDDWSIDKKVTVAANPIRITWTNLNKNAPLKIAANELAWVVYGMGEKDAQLFGAAPVLDKDIVLEDQMDSYEWLWDANVESGLYRLVVRPATEHRDRAMLQVHAQKKPEETGENRSIKGKESKSN